MEKDQFIEAAPAQPGPPVTGVVREHYPVDVPKGAVIVDGPHAGQTVAKVEVDGGEVRLHFLGAGEAAGPVAVEPRAQLLVVYGTALERLGRTELRTAAGVVARFCRPDGGGEPEGVRDRKVVRYAGWIGYPWADEGYEVLGALPPEWLVMPEAGDWPYHIFWRHPGDRALLEYTEGDLSLEIADDDAAFRALVKGAVAEFPCP